MAWFVSIKRIRECNCGAAVVEFAFVLPIILSFLMGIMSYGQWFYFAHAMQQIANDAARATVPGLSATERASLAQSAVDQDLTTIAGLNKGAARLTVQDDGTQVKLTMTYDASSSPMLRKPLVPLPSTTINRSAIVQIGNF